MEKMPYQERFDEDTVLSPALAVPSPETTNDWRSGLPALAGTLVTLCELRVSDAASLFLALASDEVTRFISPPPSSVEGFERFIAWSHRQRAAGQYVCFAVVPRGSDTALGLFQIRSLEPAFGAAEWGFALAPELWGTGFFSDGAQLAIGFAFDTLGAHRLEARASVRNSRGNAALRKLGALREGTLRNSFLRNGEYHDQVLWSILADEWRTGQVSGEAPVIH
jgi:RimJ/RimL family protein N-acetyltransferase